MGTPRSENYNAASGGTVRAGLTTPAPAWMTAATLAALTAMPNSAGAGGSAVDAYSDFVVTDKLDVYITCAGGHQNSSDNRVTKYDGSSDSPAGWTTAAPGGTPSASVQVDVAYYNDGKPTSRHTYNYTFFVPTLGTKGSIVMVGCYAAFTATSPLAFNSIDVFDIATNTWAAAGTYPYTVGSSLGWSLGSGQYGARMDKSTGNIFFQTGSGQAVNQWTPGQSSFVNKGSTVDSTIRFPNAWDSLRTAFFGIQYNDGQGGGSGGLTAKQTLNPSSGSPTIRTITFNSSAALTQLLSDAPGYIGMDYDEIRDKFLMVYNPSLTTDTAARYIEITPNSGTVWDMALVTPTGNAGLVSHNGMCGRVKYVRRGTVGGFLIMTQAANGLYFYRTA